MHPNSQTPSCQSTSYGRTTNTYARPMMVAWYSRKDGGFVSILGFGRRRLLCSEDGGFSFCGERSSVRGKNSNSTYPRWRDGTEGHVGKMSKNVGGPVEKCRKISKACSSGGEASKKIPMLERSLNPIRSRSHNSSCIFSPSISPGRTRSNPLDN